jgi:hypothetical protein
MRARLAVGVWSEIRGGEHETDDPGDAEQIPARTRDIVEPRFPGCRQTPSIDHPHRLIEAIITAFHRKVVKESARHLRSS